MPQGKRICALVLLAVLALTSGALADEASTQEQREVPEIRATKINPETPKIDGDLSDPLWVSHEFDFARNFTQTSPNEGEVPSESTVVAIAFDDDALYAAFWCYDSEPDKIMGQLSRRDRYTDADRVSVRIDPYHDHQTGYLFLVNVSGSQRDFRMYNDEHMDMSWDAVWEAETKRQPWGWTAEFRIPYSCLRFSEKEEHTWGANFIRTISRNAESSVWSFTPSSEGGAVSRFGHIGGLTGIKPARHFEVLPYAVSKLDTELKCDGNPDGRDIFGNTGIDLKYGISSNLVLDATVNPDFGQVELDRPVLNLSSFETWYPEKRPFFLEGSNLFNTRFDMFYSRRIGRSPRGWPDDSDYITHMPTTTTILGAGKLTGKISDKTSIAVLNAVTQEEKAEYVNCDGIESEAVVEPKANYSVVRITRDILNSSSIGVMGTLASQDTYHPAMSGGVDWRLSTNDGVWGTYGQVVTSRVDGENTGFGLDMSFDKNAGRHVRGAVGIVLNDPHLDLNDLGFLHRNDRRHCWSWVQYRTEKELLIFRKTFHNFNTYWAWNYRGERIQGGGNYNFYLEFTNLWSFGGGINTQFERWDDRETRGNGSWNNPSQWGWWASLDSDNRKPVSFCINPGSGGNHYGEWWANYVGVEVRPKPNMEFAIGTNFVRGFGQSRWIGNYDDPETEEVVSVFADLDQDEITPRVSASVNFTRDLSVQLSCRMLFSALDHQNYRRYTGNETYDELGVLVDGNGDAVTVSYLESGNDYNFRAFNSTLVLRWEYRPGSTIYAVWTQARRGVWADNNLDFGNDFRELFSSRYYADGEGIYANDNVFLIKANYWLNL